MHLAFASEICELQAKAGRCFLHEHQATADSWKRQPITKLLKVHGVSAAVSDTCAFGMTSIDPSGKEELVLKPARWASNAPLLLKRLGVRCSNKGRDGRRHARATLDGKGRAAAAVVCPPLLCLEILRGLRDQLQADGHDLEENVLAAIREEEKQERASRYHTAGNFMMTCPGRTCPKHSF